METIRKINDTLAIAGQISLDQLSPLAEEGFCSILNVRSPEEAGFLAIEATQARAMGLVYVHCPFKTEALSEEILLQAFKQINDLPKPLLVHCDTGIRAALIILIYITMQQGTTVKQAIYQAEQLGLIPSLAPKPS